MYFRNSPQIYVQDVSHQNAHDALSNAHIHAWKLGECSFSQLIPKSFRLQSYFRENVAYLEHYNKNYNVQWSGGAGVYLQGSSSAWLNCTFEYNFANYT